MQLEGDGRVDFGLHSRTDGGGPHHRTTYVSASVLDFWGLVVDAENRADPWARLGNLSPAGFRADEEECRIPRFIHQTRQTEDWGWN